MTARIELARISAGVIFCGGEGLRLGGGKPNRELDGRTLLDRIATRLVPQCAMLGVSVRGSGDAPDGFDEIVDIPASGGGPLLGLVAALRWAALQPGIRYLLTSPVDTPFLPIDLAERLGRALQDRGSLAAVATSGGRVHGLSALYDVALLPRAELLVLERGERKVGRLHDVLPSAHVDFAADPVDPFLNVNTPADLEKAREWLEACTG